MQIHLNLIQYYVYQAESPTYMQEIGQCFRVNYVKRIYSVEVKTYTCACVKVELSPFCPGNKFTFLGNLSLRSIQ